MYTHFGNLSFRVFLINSGNYLKIYIAVSFINWVILGHSLFLSVGKEATTFKNHLPRKTAGTCLGSNQESILIQRCTCACRQTQTWSHIHAHRDKNIKFSTIVSVLLVKDIGSSSYFFFAVLLRSVGVSYILDL